MNGFFIVIIIIIIIYFIYTLFPTQLKTTKDSTIENLVSNDINNGLPESQAKREREIEQLTFFKNIAKEHNVNQFVRISKTSWCHFCQEMEPTWNQVKQKNNQNDIYIMLMLENDEDENHTPGISSYPTIIKYNNGQLFKYNGGNNADALYEFVKFNPLEIK